ncbi:hypothetical protein [Saccharothrix sp. NRRL B-16314]|uniref:hypothetical protein n=1 Tax=Saccharothrix sp. NRRL B-16314 TaxID=1463825 RepID=UPI000526046D|nr:hypothetical protein [Saccharothrix sp. NRRL B-16314]
MVLVLIAVLFTGWALIGGFAPMTVLQMLGGVAIVIAAAARIDPGTVGRRSRRAVEALVGRA